MMRELPKQIIEWSLVVALVLFLYGREQRHAGRDMEQSRSARAQIIAASDRADSLAARYALATRRGIPYLASWQRRRLGGCRR